MLEQTSKEKYGSIVYASEGTSRLLKGSKIFTRYRILADPEPSG